MAAQANKEQRQRLHTLRVCFLGYVCLGYKKISNKMDGHHGNPQLQLKWNEGVEL